MKTNAVPALQRSTRRPTSRWLSGLGLLAVAGRSVALKEPLRGADVVAAALDDAAPSIDADVGDVALGLTSDRATEVSSLASSSEETDADASDEEQRSGAAAPARVRGSEVQGRQTEQKPPTKPATSPAAPKQNGPNPLAKIVVMLKSLKTKIAAEAVEENTLFEEHMCFCKTETQKLKVAISGYEEKKPQLEGELEESSSAISSLSETVKSQSKDLKDAQTALSEAKAQRESDSAAFTKSSDSLRTNIKGLEKAIKSLQQGSQAMLLQSPVADVLRGIVAGLDTSESDSDDSQVAHNKEVLTSFLSGGTSGNDLLEVLGICKQLKESMDADLKDAIEEENKAKEAFGKLSKAKSSEIESTQQVIATSKEQIGSLKVKVDRLRQDLESTVKSLAQSKELLGKLTKTCDDAMEEYHAREAYRVEENKAIDEAVKILSTGAEMGIADRFRDQLSLIETARRHRRRQGQHGAADVVQQITQRRLRGGGKKQNWKKILQLIDETLRTLDRQQRAETKEFNFCTKEIGDSKAEDSQLSADIKDLRAQMEEKENMMSGIQKDIAALVQSIKAQDDEVKKATKERKAEHDEHIRLLAANHQATTLIDNALWRLNDVYGKSFAQESEPKTSNMTPRKANERGSSILKLMETVKSDIARETKLAKEEEKKAQTDYEALMKDAAAKHASDANRLVQLEANRADAEVRLGARRKQTKEKGARQGLVRQYLAEMHTKCDTLLKNYESHKAAREGEAKALKSARATLAVSSK